MSYGQAHPVKGILATRRITIRRMATGIGRNESHVSLVLNGYRSMTPEMAATISTFLGGVEVRARRRRATAR